MEFHKMKRFILFIGFFLSLSVIAQATTWYVRPDGGTRYDTNGGGYTPNGGCNGTTDAAYPGTTNQTWFPGTSYSLGTTILGTDGYYQTVTTAGTSQTTYWPSWGSTTTDGTVTWTRGSAYPKNQNCAFNDYRYLWNNMGYANSAWVISGGDTVVIRGCVATPQNGNTNECRVGFEKSSSNGGGYSWCVGGSGSGGCSNPTIPSGTSGQHTRILGQNYASCSNTNGTAANHSLLTQLFGGFGVYTTFNLAGAQYVDVQCLEITQHNGQCILHGLPAYPRACVGGVDDYDATGVSTSNTTSNLLLQDVWIHGNGNNGILGPIGGPVVMNRVEVNFNGFTGWNFDDGNDTADAAGSSITANYVTMEGNGCNEEYPIVHTAFPAISCYDLSSNGFGDSWSGQDTELDSFVCNHCTQIYNTKDGFIGPHTSIRSLTITNSTSYGNMGQQWKFVTPVNGSISFTNNLTIGNCFRLAEQLPGAPYNYNMSTSSYGGAGLSLYCRAAGDFFSYSPSAGATVVFNNNTIVGYSSTVIDIGCTSSGTCGTASNLFTNNIFLGYINQNPLYEATDGYTGEAPGLFYDSDPGTSNVVTSNHNIEYGIRNGDACTGSILCVDPKFVNEPTVPLTLESSLDNFNYNLQNTSPAIDAGTTPCTSVDYVGHAQTSPCTMGAYVYSPIGGSLVNFTGSGIQITGGNIVIIY
jgi:hypothetical protein